jgi:tripartite-type tricarboxylate transporter receptor subunit TctC
VTNKEFDEKFKNFKPLAVFGSFTGVIIAHRRSGIKTFPQLMDRIANSPTNIAVTGGQQFSLLAQTVFPKTANTNLIPYPTGDAALISQFLGGHIDFAVVALHSTMISDLIANGTAVALGGTNSTTLNGIPPLKEFGISPVFLPHYVVYGLQSMPQGVSDQITQQIMDAADSSGFHEFLVTNKLHKIARKDMKSMTELQYTMIPKYQQLLQQK